MIKRLVVDDDRLRGVELAEGHLVPRSAVFVFPRMVPRDALLRSLGCARGEEGWVTTDRSGRTSVSGVWAVGNVTDARALVITVAGLGAAAAFAINHDLVAEDVEHALKDHRAADATSPAPIDRRSYLLRSTPAHAILNPKSLSNHIRPRPSRSRIGGR